MMQAQNLNVDPFRYSAEDLLGFIREAPEGLPTLFSQFTTRYLHIGQLGIERNTFINWEKGGLIPYDREESGWRKFSFVEAVWVKTVEEMRALGVPTDTIRDVKEKLWSTEGEEFARQVMESLKRLPQDMPQRDLIQQGMEEEGLAGVKRMLALVQLSPFLWIVMGAVLRKATFLVSINKHGGILLLPLLSTTEITDPRLAEGQRALLATSSTIISLRGIIESLAFEKEVHLGEEVLLQLLSPQEREILQLVKEKEYSEILIQKDEGGEPHQIKVTRRGVSEEAIKKLHAFLKRGKFQGVQFKTRDGQLIHFEETSVIKLTPKRGRGRPRKTVQ